MDFNKMTKSQILDYLETQGVAASLRARKDTLVKLAEELFAKQMAEQVMEENEETLEVLVDSPKETGDVGLWKLTGYMILAGIIFIAGLLWVAL